MNIIQFMIAVFIVVYVTYLLCGQTLFRQKKNPTSNAITSEDGKAITIYLHNSTEEHKWQ